MDTGLHSLVAIARFHQLPAEPEQLAHQFAEPGKPFSDTQLLSAAKALTLRAKRISPSLRQIKTDTLPAIAKAQDGSYFILARLDEGSGADGESTTRTYLIHDLREQAPCSISHEEFEALWSADFFQAVMDKVLVHRGFTTLDVLAIGFFVIVLFEAFLGGLKISIEGRK